MYFQFLCCYCRLTLLDFSSFFPTYYFYSKILVFSIESRFLSSPFTLFLHTDGRNSNGKTIDLAMIPNLNWLIHMAFARQDYKYCNEVIEYQFSETYDHEYLYFIKVNLSIAQYENWRTNKRINKTGNRQISPTDNWTFYGIFSQIRAYFFAPLWTHVVDGITIQCAFVVVLSITILMCQCFHSFWCWQCVLVCEKPMIRYTSIASIANLTDLY